MALKKIRALLWVPVVRSFVTSQNPFISTKHLPVAREAQGSFLGGKRFPPRAERKRSEEENRLRRKAAADKNTSNARQAHPVLKYRVPHGSHHLFQRHLWSLQGFRKGRSRGNLARTPDVAVVISLNRFLAPVDDTVTAHPKMFRLFITERKGNIHWNVPSHVEASKAALKQLPACHATRGKTEEPYDPQRTVFSIQ